MDVDPKKIKTRIKFNFYQMLDYELALKSYDMLKYVLKAENIENGYTDAVFKDLLILKRDDCATLEETLVAIRESEICDSPHVGHFLNIVMVLRNLLGALHRLDEDVNEEMLFDIPNVGIIAFVDGLEQRLKNLEDMIDFTPVMSEDHAEATLIGQVYRDAVKTIEYNLQILTTFVEKERYSFNEINQIISNPKNKDSENRETALIYNIIHNAYDSIYNAFDSVTDRRVKNQIVWENDPRPIKGFPDDFQKSVIDVHDKLQAVAARYNEVILPELEQIYNFEFRIKRFTERQ